MKTKIILWIEDEFNYNLPYYEALLKARYQVQFCKNINDGFEWFQALHGVTQLVIIDVMMFQSEKIRIPGFDVNLTGNGRRTGEILLPILNKIANNSEVPKIFFTNISDEKFHQKYNNSSIINGSYKKREFLPSELVEIVEKNIKK